MNGAEVLVDALKREGVEFIFGYPGGTVIPIFDVLSWTKEIKVVLTRHEQAATHAADGYARASGKVGICLTTSGPGATNTITGIATAKMDSIPIIVISGQVHTDVIGTDAFQETDMAGLTRSICKHSYLVQRIEDLPRIIKESFYLARSGRPGPISIDLPVDVAGATIADYHYPSEVNLPGYRPTIKGNARQLMRLAQAMQDSKKPLLYAGGGVISSGASFGLLSLLEKTNIPIVTTLMGFGCVPSEHRLFLGMPGMHGRIAANYALAECDLLIALGVRFDDRVTGDKKAFARHAVVAHVDIDPAEIGKNIKTHIPIVGDVKSVLAELLPRIKQREPSEWNIRTESWKKEFPLRYDQKENGEILPQYVIDRIDSFSDAGTIIVTDVGQHQMWTALYYSHQRPRAFLTSGGLGTMGFGLPAAIGAALARPGHQVICISGDGGIQMNIQELATCAINRIPVKIAVLNNSYLGMVRQWQEIFWKGNYSKTCLRQGPECPDRCRGPYEENGCRRPYIPDLVKLAEANGIQGLRAGKPREVDSVLRKGLEAEGPVLMEFLVRSMENVYPMVPAGKPINEILVGPP